MNPEIRPSPLPEKLSKEREAELVAAAARLFRTGFPNPDRIGCPAREALMDLARRGPGSGEGRGVVDHLTCCSQCFVEYEQFLRRERVARTMRLLALCASVLITVGLAVWLYAFRGETGTTGQSFEVATIDLRGQSRLRGEQIPEPAPAEGAIPVVPAKRVTLSIMLPVGSEEGPYRIQIRGQEESPHFVGQGQAVFEERNVVLRIQADLRELDPRIYLLGIRKAEFRWEYYSVEVVK